MKRLVNKYGYSDMKYTLINKCHSIIPLLCLIILAISCIKEVALSEESSYIFTGVVENGEARAQLNAEGTVAWWEPNDAIRIFCEEGDARFKSSLTTSGATSDFVCEQKDFLADAKQYFAVYPYSQNDTYDGESITVTIPSVQTAIEESFDRSAFIMMAQSSNHTLNFKNLCGGVKIKINVAGYNRIVIRGNNNEILAGKVRVHFLDGVPVVKEILEGEQTVELRCPSGQSFQKGWYYIPCLPTTFLQGYTVEIWETENETIKGEYYCSEQSSIMRSTWSRLYRLDNHVVYSSSQSVFYITHLGSSTPVQLNESEHVISHYWDFRSGYFVILLDKETHELDGGIVNDLYKTWITRIIIPPSVTSIGGFGGLSYRFDNLYMVIIPSSVTSIKDEAFLKCTSLEIIDLPPSVTSIGSSAFASCNSLKSITIPNGVTSIEKETFHYCRSLESVTIPSSVTTIGMKAFRYCTSLKSIDIPSSVTSIGSYAFESCDNIKRVTIPSSVTSIGDYAFQGCDSLKSVTISSSVTNIGYSFEICNSLDSVIVKASVPPVIGPSSSYAYSAGFPSGVKIYVPYSAVEAYKSSINWEKYKTNIVGADIHEDDLPPENPPVDNPPVENATYQVGDIYKENGHAVGIVFWVADDGRSAKVVSLSRLSGQPWSNESSLTNFGVTSTDNGAGNTSAIRSEAAAAGIIDNIPWLVFLDGLGDGWYLPAINELKTLAATYYGVDSYGIIPSGTPNTLASSVVSKMEMFEKLITDNGGTRINTMSGDQNGDSLFSSTETDSGDKAYYVRFGKISHDTGNKTSTVRTFRGVKLVTLH